MEKVKEGYKITESGEIPEEWEVKGLIEVADKSDRYSFTGGPFGSDLKACHYTDSGVRVIQLKNIGDGNFNNNNFIYTSEIKANELISCNVYCGDIIIAKMAEPVARACKIPDYERRYLMCSDGIRLSVDKIKNDVDFIMYSINSKYFRNNAIANSTGSTRLRIGLSELKKLPIVIPTLKEQQKISLILSSLDEKIEITNNLIEKTKELKKGLMQRLFTKGIGHDRFKDTEIGRIPEEWELKSIDEVAKFQGGYAFKSSDYVENGIKLIKITNVQQKNLVWDDVSNLPEEFIDRYEEYKLKYNDVVIAMTRPIISTGIKVCRIKHQDIPSLLNQRVGRFVINEKLDSGYLYQYTFSNYFINKVNELSSTTGQPNISGKQIESILIPVPSVGEQSQIASIISSVDEKIQQYETKKEKLQELKKGLMQKLLTGKIRVN